MSNTVSIRQIDSQTSSETGPAASFTRPRFAPISELSIQQLADEYGDRDLEYKQFQPISDRRDALKEAIQAHFEDAAAEESLFIDGSRWQIEVKPRINEDKIVDIQKVRRAMGSEAFWEACTKAMNRALGTIREAVGKQKYPGLVVTERTGYRRLVATAKAAPREPAKAA